MGYRDRSIRRPGILNTLALFSFVLSVLNVIWVVVVALIVAILGVTGFVTMPGIGIAVAAVAAIIVALLLAQSALSVLLFAAAWKTWGGDPGGRSLHLAWAWITVVFDLVDLAFTAGLDGGAWVRLIYAAIVILVMKRNDVEAYFDRRRYGASMAKASPPDDYDA